MEIHISQLRHWRKCFVLEKFHQFKFSVCSFADTKDKRYNPRMDPVIHVQNWRKGSQVKFQ